MSHPIPFTVIFYANGMAAVCDARGRQIPEYQGRHDFVVEALGIAGHRWQDLPEVIGVPLITRTATDG